KSSTTTFWRNFEIFFRILKLTSTTGIFYIEDIAVCKDFRGQGIGSALINISIEWAKHKNLHGLMLETQDNNLIACKFYHNCGFKIGSVDTMLYANFENNFEKAVFWYLRF
ncbi:GNAT family N-acetyltransferase, partial [Enterococcus faecalis]|uniref:GNAT family N-acetyltransferase n=8 Tax=Enterococcus TaxID=1350 RepID=UPI001CE19DB2